MIFYEYGLVKCPQCKRGLDASMLHVSSGLGPPVVRCCWCDSKALTGRTEWWDMNAIRKSWYVVLSCFYAAIAYFMGGHSTSQPAYLFETGEFKNAWGLDEPIFWIGGASWVAVLIVIQIYRVIQSKGRWGIHEDEAFGRCFWTFQVGGQIKFLILILLIPLGCLIAARLLQLIE